MRPRAQKLMEAVRSGALDATAVLENLLFNYMSADDADDFAVTEYFQDEEDEDG